MFGDFSGGGGFLNDTKSDDVTNAKTVNRRLQNVVPITVRHLKQANIGGKDGFKYFGMPVQIVSIVGILRSLEVDSVKATCKIHDCTGAIKGILWLEPDQEGNTKLPPIKEGHYVQVYGSVREENQQITIMILEIHTVDDCNILTNHLLQVLHVRLSVEAAKKNKFCDGATAANKPGGQLAQSMMSLMATNDESVMSFGGGGMGRNWNPMQEKIFKLIEPIKSETGMHIGLIMRHFNSGQARDVRNALEFLVGEGHIYSTIDNEHFKATDSF